MAGAAGGAGEEAGVVGMSVRAARSGRSGGFFRKTVSRVIPVLPVLPILPVLLGLPACARMEPPPGGPPDAEPPRLIATRPDTLASLGSFRGVAEFQFDEVISEGGAPNR